LKGLFLSNTSIVFMLSKLKFEIHSIINISFPRYYYNCTISIDFRYHNNVAISYSYWHGTHLAFTAPTHKIKCHFCSLLQRNQGEAYKKVKIKNKKMKEKHIYTNIRTNVKLHSSSSIQCFDPIVILLPFWVFHLNIE
jgi:hypothetical protein